MTRAPSRLERGLAALSRPDKLLLGVVLGLGLLALSVGGLAALGLALAAGDLADVGAARGFELLTVHASSAFYYWLYFAQAGVVLAFLLALTDGARLTRAWRLVAFAGVSLMAAGWAVDLVEPMQGKAVLYSVPDELAAAQFDDGGWFLVGYVLLAVGLLLTALSGIAVALGAKVRGGGREWGAVTFAAFLWEAFVAATAVVSLLTYGPAALRAFGADPVIPDFDYGLSWAVLFHNMHYLPLLSTVLVWYVLAEATTGVSSVYGERLSKVVFASYLVIVPPTSLYHLYLEPTVGSATKAVGSVMAVFISVPTILVFLLIVSSLQRCAGGQGARGLFGWVGRLPWRNPAFAAMGMAALSALGGGVIANVLIQERFASLLSDTFAVPGYFHFFTVGTVTLTLVGALTYVVPALTGHALAAPRLAAFLPYLVAASVYVFGVAGVVAGYAGVPRQTLDYGYGGDAPGSWAPLMTAVGVGGVGMVAGGALYVALLGLTAVRSARRGRRLAELPAASFAPGDARGQRAWFGPAAVGVLVGGIYVATIVAYRLIESLPVEIG